MTLVEGKESMNSVEASSKPNNQTPKSLKAKPRIVKKPVNNSVTSTEASSEPNNQTPKSLKAKPKIVKKPVNNSVTSTSKAKDTPPTQGKKKIIKKKIVGGNKTINKKEDVQSVDARDLKQKDVLIGEQSKNNLTNLKEKSVRGIIKMNGTDDKVDPQNLNKEELKHHEVISGDDNKNNNVNSNKKKKVVVRKRVKNGDDTESSQALNKKELEQKNDISVEKSLTSPSDVNRKVDRDEKNRENFGRSKNKRHKQNSKDKNYSADGNGLLSNQQKQNNKEKLSGSGGNEVTHEKKGNRHQVEGERKDKTSKKLGGVIFFCSAKTKADCFHYHIMGVTTSKKDLVLSIKPGLKLFLYDIGLKLLYGVYKASSPGGMKLEPAAFNGSFPVQVRFEIYKDCYPLPESVFKKAIQENYDGNNKFDPDLSFQQVNKLMELFKPADVKEHVPPPMYLPGAMNVGREEAKGRETEYLTHHRREHLAREPYSYYEGSRRYDLHSNKNDERLAYRRGRSPQRETTPEKLFLNERDYRTFGLRRERRNVTPPRTHVAPNLELDPRGAQEHLLVRGAQEHPLVHPGNTYRYAEKEYPSAAFSHFPRQDLHSSDPRVDTIVDSYLKVPYYGSSSDPYQVPPRREREEVALGSYSLGKEETTYQPGASYLPRREVYPSQTNHYPTEASYVGMRENNDVGSLYSSYASKALSEYNQQHTSEGARPQTSLATVTARYSFAGPSRQH